MRHSSIAAAVALLAAPAAAQTVPYAVSIAGDPAPGAPGWTFSSLEAVAPSHSAGLVVSVSASTIGGAQFEDQLWGTSGGTSLTWLRRAGPAGPLAVAGFDGIPGLGGGDVASAVSAGGLRAVIAGDDLVALQGATTAPGGATWFTFEDAAMDSTGRPWFKGRFVGAQSGIGLFRGRTPAPVFLSGGTIQGMAGTVSPSGAPYRGWDVSGDGGQWMAVVRSSTQRDHVVVNGAVLTAGGVPLVTGNTLPPAFQLTPNETYNSFGQVQVAAPDVWAATGGTPGGFILRDGTMYRRIGQTVDGATLSGVMRSIAMDDAGALAYIAGADHGDGQGPVDTVFREDDVLFAEGDGVDVDGDGLADAGYTIRDIPGGVGRLAHLEDGTVWVIAEIGLPGGGFRNALLTTGVTMGLPHCSSQPHVGGHRARIQALGSTVLADHDLSLRCVDMPTQAYALFIASRDAGFVPGAGGSQGDLCLGGTLGRYNAQLQNSGTAGMVEIPVDLTAIPAGPSLVAAVPGATWHFQCWFRDLAGGVATSNFSDAVGVTLR